MLLVEDEASVRSLAERVLQRRGWTVIAADSGDAALSALAPGQRLDLVVTDIVMPGIGGPELVRRLRAERAGLPAILVSGYAEETVVTDLASQATAFVPKPYSLADLLRVMDQAMHEASDVPPCGPAASCHQLLPGEAASTPPLVHATF